MRLECWSCRDERTCKKRKYNGSLALGLFNVKNAQKYLEIILQMFLKTSFFERFAWIGRADINGQWNVDGSVLGFWCFGVSFT